MPMAPTKRDCSSNSATGEVCERCIASMTIFSDVPGRAQKTCGASSGSFSTSSQDTQTAGLPSRSAAATSPLASILKRVVLRRSSQTQSSPADFQVAAVAHDVPCGQHRQRVHIGDEVARRSRWRA